MISVFVWTVRDIFELIGTGFSILVLIIFVIWIGITYLRNKPKNNKRKGERK